LSESRQINRWRKPGLGEIKTNFDGAFITLSGDGGWGFAIRDETGAVLKSGAGWEEHLQDALHVELLGCVVGLRAAASMGIAVINLETNALMVKTMTEEDDYLLSAMGGVITELKHLLATKIAGFGLNACPRSCNSLAHELAAIGCKLPSGSQTTSDDVTQELEALVSSELAVAVE
jgi:hypothetical protein